MNVTTPTKPVTVAAPTPNPKPREFNPDRRWYHPFAAVAWLYFLGGAAQWTHLPAWTMIAAGLAMTVAAVATAKRQYSALEYGRTQSRQTTRFTWATGIVATVWLVYAGWTPRDTAWLAVSVKALGLLLVAGLALGAFYGMITTKAPARKEAVDSKRADDHAAYSQAQMAAYQERIAAEHAPMMERAKLPGMKVIDKQETSAGFMLVILDSPENPYKFDGLHAQCGTIASLLAHELAPQGVRLGGHQVRAEETDSAHMFHLHVSTKNVFRGNLDYRFDQPVTSIRKPLVPALYEDGKPVEITLYGRNVVHVGTTGSGKTVFANNVIAGVTRCSDAVMWIGATSKLTPLLIPWLAPWLLGHTNRPVIDLVAGQCAQRVTDMLAAFYHAVCRHNDQLGKDPQRVATPADPSIVCIIEEASDLLEDYSTVKSKTFNGHNWNASQIINAICRIDRSAGDSLYMLTQYGLMDALGTEGNKAKRNITVRIAGRTETAHDGYATLVRMSHVDTTKLDSHMVLVQPSIETPRAIPAKAFHLDGDELIAPVANRNTANKPSLPAYITEALGDAYTLRWDPERLPELARAAHLSYGVTWPTPPPVSLPSPSSVTVDATPATVAVRELTDEEAAMTSDQLLERGAVQMAAARANIEKYGTLGPTMAPIFEKVRAENAPPFIPVALLAKVIGWDGDHQGLIGELSTSPWDLLPTEQDGEPGWFKGDILDSIRRYLTGAGGAPSPREEGVPAETVALLTALKESLSISSGQEWVTTDEIFEAVADQMGWGNPVDGGRKLSAALSPLGVRSDRPSIGGRKRMAYPADVLTSTIERYARVVTATN